MNRLDTFRGTGFPEVVQRPSDRRGDWFESYLTAVVEREVRDLSPVGHVAELVAMIRLIAARSGSSFNLADVARGAQLSHSTARRYLGLLRAVFLAWRFPRGRQASPRASCGRPRCSSPTAASPPTCWESTASG